MKLIKRAGILIPREYENKEFYKQIKEFLIRKSTDYTKSVLITNEFYLESEKYLLIPRNFPIWKYAFHFEMEDMRHEGEDIDIVHNITPRSLSQERAIDHMMNTESCILQLSPGVGKTVISIYMIAERKKKSLILVHRDSLAEQWKDRIKTFTNMTDENIARLSTKTFEEDLDKPIIISTAQTFVSLLKRNRKNFLIKLDDANIGIFIADEVHTSVGAPTFSECSIHMPSKYTYGLSATPYRYDGNGDVIEFHLGGVFADDDTEGTMPARVTAILVDYQIDTARRSYYVRWGGEFQRARYLNLMKKSASFRQTLKQLLKKLILNNRDILCMAERIKLIDELYKETQTPSKSKFCGSAGLEELESKLTFSTPQKCRDGIDAPQKDCVIMTSPISNVEQLTGRVVRKKEGKKEPIVIDMVDYGCEPIAATFIRRLQFYESKNWPIQILFVDRNKIKELNKREAIKMIRGGQ